MFSNYTHNLRENIVQISGAVDQCVKIDPKFIGQIIFLKFLKGGGYLLVTNLGVLYAY
jgi:hypothetical protein